MILTNSGVLKLMQRIKSYIASQLNTKAPSVHTHTLSEIDDLSSLQMGGGYTKSEVDTLLNGKSDTSHTHTTSDVTDFPTLATVATSGSYNDLSNKPATMTPASHAHGNITNDGKIGSNANKPLITTTGGTVTTGSFGTSANTFCEGNDSRLSDARTPTSHTHTKSEITDFPNLSTVATSGSYNDLSNKPTIPTVNNATLTIQKNGTTVKTFTANASSNVTANITVPTKVSELDNDSNYLTTVPNLDASKITSGTIDIARLPAGALERLVTVTNRTARFALTTSSVQLGDVVKQSDTGVMYYVVDTANLNSEDGYSEFTAGSATSVPWSGVTGKPSSYTPSSHTHGNITNAGAIGSTANKPLITTTNGVITTGSFGTTANTFCQGNDSRLSDARTPTAHTHSASDITSGLATVATSGSYNDLSNTPTIPTVNDGTLTIQKNGTTVDTFTANSSADKTVNISVPTKTSDLNNDSGFITSDTTKIPLAGTNALAGSIIPSTDNAYNFGSSNKAFSNIWVKMIRATQVNYPNDTSYLSICGGTTYHHGAQLVLAGMDDTSRKGEFIIRAYNSTDGEKNLEGKANGTLTWNGKNIAMQEDVVPRSGGAVMTGANIGRSDNEHYLNLCGGNGWSGGAAITATGKDVATNPGLITLHPSIGTQEKTMHIFPDGTWGWNGTACQITSDQRYKQQITEIDDKLLDAWEDVDLVQFKYNDAVDQKKDNARLHTGYVVQQIDEACKSHNVDISEYGLYCHEEYPEETEEVEVEQADGTKIKEKKVIREASEHYSLRYTETLVVECAYLRRENTRLKQQMQQYSESLNKLEERLKALEQTSK